MHFEFTCHRSGLFNESYLSSAVGQILSATFGDRVHGQFDHPILAPTMIGPGRRPAIDFVYCDPYPAIKVAVETKWAGSSHTTPESIIWDLIRLELLAHKYGAECIFLLAGMAADLKRLFQLVEFSGPPQSTEQRQILNTVDNSLSRLWLLPRPYYRIPLMRRVMSRCQNVALPHALITRRSKPFPAVSPNNHFQVFAWEVKSADNRPEFRPSENKHYRVQIPT